MKFKTIEWKGDGVRILDQRKLPHKVRYQDCRSASSVVEAIRTMAIRGAPAIGVAAAMGIALAAKKSRSVNPQVFADATKKVCREMRETRPTAVNLFWAVDRMEKILGRVESDGVEKTNFAYPRGGSLPARDERHGARVDGAGGGMRLSQRRHSHHAFSRARELCGDRAEPMARRCHSGG